MRSSQGLKTNTHAWLLVHSHGCGCYNNNNNDYNNKQRKKKKKKNDKKLLDFDQIINDQTTTTLTVLANLWHVLK